MRCGGRAWEDEALDRLDAGLGELARVGEDLIGQSKVVGVAERVYSVLRAVLRREPFIEVLFR